MSIRSLIFLLDSVARRRKLRAVAGRCAPYLGLALEVSEVHLIREYDCNAVMLLFFLLDHLHVLSEELVIDV